MTLINALSDWVDSGHVLSHTHHTTTRPGLISDWKCVLT